jgi:hypothetical protein
MAEGWRCGRMKNARLRDGGRQYNCWLHYLEWRYGCIAGAMGNTSMNHDLL